MSRGYENSQSIIDILERVDHRFPFFVESWYAQHKIMKVIGYHHSRKKLLGELYSRDDRVLLSTNAVMPIDSAKGWVLLDMDIDIP